MGLGVLKKRRTLIVALVFSALVGIGAQWYSPVAEGDGDRVSFWLWAGYTPEDVPPNSELYVHQGLMRVDSGVFVYERRGLFPHPMKCRKLFLVYRMEGQFPDVGDVVDEFTDAVSWWQRHPVSVTGLQLDFDSPTAKLDAYSRFLREVRRQLPRGFALSITGLGDWVVSGDRKALGSISASVDEVVIQLYQGRQPLADIDYYIAKLVSFPRPFRIGLISGFEPPESVGRLQDNPAYDGVIYFVQGAI